MRKLLVIGIGAGNPDHMTVQAISSLNRADVLFIPDKGAKKNELAELRREICDRFVTNPKSRRVEFDVPVRAEPTSSYRSTVDDWHEAIAAIYEALIRDEIAEDGCGAFLIWGDPSLYDSSLRIARRLEPLPEIEVIPGVTAIQALCAAHAIPLNKIGASFLVTTGRQLRECGWPAGVTTIAVMLDGGTAFQSLDPDGLHIWWGAYLGMPHQIIFAGPLAEVAATIAAARAEARQRHGWIMDCYILKRVSGEG